MRVLHHPVLGKLRKEKVVKITVDGKILEASEGEPIIAALLANGIRVCRKTKKKDEPRFLFCGIGRCNDCYFTVFTPLERKLCRRAPLEILSLTGFTTCG